MQHYGLARLVRCGGLFQWEQRSWEFCECQWIRDWALQVVARRTEGVEHACG